MEEEKSFKKNFRENWLPLIYLIVGLLALRWTIVEPYVVPTGSMEPTLKPGDRLYALKCAYDVRLPFTDFILFKVKPVKRGDVILFRYPRDPSVTYVKRAVGVAGDTVEMREGVVYVNNQEVAKAPTDDRTVMYDIDRESEKTLYIETLNGVRHYVILDNEMPFKRNFGPVTIPPGYLFASGDNRDNSSDSRVWGFVPEDYLKGQAMFIWYSSKDWKPRFERIGTLIQ
jgi:signal peptidase I